MKPSAFKTCDDENSEQVAWNGCSGARTKVEMFSSGAGFTGGSGEKMQQKMGMKGPENVNAQTSTENAGGNC